MNRLRWLGLGISFFLAGMALAVAVSISPRTMTVTGPALCASGRRFVVNEGATITLPDHRRVAPMRMACVAPDGAREPAHFGRALVVFFAANWCAWGAGLWVLAGVMRRRLARPPTRSPGV